MTPLSIAIEPRAAWRRSGLSHAALAAIPLAILLSPCWAQADDAAIVTWQADGQTT